jgi:hypothetical protein
MKKNSYALYAALYACCLSCGSNSTSETAKTSSSGNAQVADANTLASSLQACSYDGKPITLAVNNFNGNASAGDVVAGILKFTGLPQNFNVVEEKVPNAAAVIVMGPDNLPQRLIAYNQSFMDEVAKATQNNNWAPISIMAHEIGHHLCGHTIMPGGSQPPTELEADKFSGYVLYKMGASLADAQKAIGTLVGDEPSETHPSRQPRLEAIRQGWEQACNQQSLECSGMAGASIPGGLGPVTSGGGNVDSGTASTGGSTDLPTGLGEVLQDQALPYSNKHAQLPQTDDKTIPTKFDHFVMDETGQMDKKTKEEISQFLYKSAKETGLEVVIVSTDNLQGKTADEFAHLMLKQLRIGKLDIGNGACLVVSPKNKAVGVGLMSGLRFAIPDDRVNDEIRTRLERYLEKKDGDKVWAMETLQGACERVIWLGKMLGSKDWVIAFNNLEEMQKIGNSEVAGSYDPETSKVFNKLIRISGTITSLNGTPNNKEAFSEGGGVPDGGRVIELKTPQGVYVALALTKYAEMLMPSKLEVGKTYSIVGREAVLDMAAFDLISYDLLK